MGFIKAYLKSMRPYTMLITGTAGLIGILAVERTGSYFEVFLSIMLLFLAYGVNQVINDLLGLREDRSNASDRPSVSGELDLKKAILMTSLIFIGGAAITIFLNIWALVIYLLAYVFNIIYEYLKGIPLLGNLWFGLMIALAPLYGAISVTNYDLLELVGDRKVIYFAASVILIQSTMCFFTYYKDIKGDREAKKRTLPTVMDLDRLKYINIIMVIAPFSFIGLITCLTPQMSLNPISIEVFLVSLLFYILIIIIFFRKNIYQKMILELNFQGAVLFQCALISFLYPVIGAVIAIASIFSIRILFFLMYRKGLY